VIREGINLLFKENRLAKGEFVGLGRKLNLHDITCPAYLLAAHRSTPQGRIILQYEPAMRSKIQMLSLRGSPYPRSGVLKRKAPAWGWGLGAGGLGLPGWNATITLTLHATPISNGCQD